MTPLQAIGFGLLQGITELFPVSSVGHAVVAPALLGWRLDQEAPTFLPFLVMLHLGTAAALALYFWRMWWTLIAAAVAPSAETRRERRLFWLLVVGTIPAAVFGGLFEHRLRVLFSVPTVAAVMLIVNAGILFWGDRATRRGGTREADELSPAQALVIGVWQSLALIPGISRSGAAMVASLRDHLSHEEAARFSFLLATPVILGAGILEVPKLLHGAGAHEALGLAVLGGVVAGLAAFASTAFLMRYFRIAEEHRALWPYAFYCLALGVVTLAVVRH